MTNFIETKQSQGKCEEVIFIYDYSFLNLVLILTTERWLSIIFTLIWSLIVHLRTMKNHWFNYGE
jgi:hypothetical protein